jgi:uncharacterized membrane protein
MADPPSNAPPSPGGTQAPPGESQPIDVSLRNSVFGLGTALCFAVSAVFIRAGLEELPSPLLGVTAGMVITAATYGIILLFRRSKIEQGPIPRDALLFQIGAGIFVGLSTWARWIALDMAPVAVVLSLGRLNVPVVLLLSPLLVGRKAERVTAKVWLGAALIVAGSVILNVYA